jgi:signal transduction histidine kinase
MGLDLIQSEMASALGYNCATSYRASEDGLPHPESGLKRKKHDNIPPQKTRDWFQLTQEIQVNAQGAVDILNDLLNYDKIEQGKLNLGLEVVPVWHLLEKAIIEFKSPASSKKVKLSLTFGEDGKPQTSLCRSQDLPQHIRSLQVIGDSVRLTQVIRNLMSNALVSTELKNSMAYFCAYVFDTNYMFFFQTFRNLHGQRDLFTSRCYFAHD